MVPSSEETGSSDGGYGALHPQRASRHLAPGASSRKPDKAMKTSRKSKEEKSPDPLMSQGMAAGQSPSELMPMMMMAYMVTQQKRDNKRSCRGREADDSLGGSSSESSGSDLDRSSSGMKAVTALRRLHRQIRRHPKRIIRDFEKELIKELGVVPGQAWSAKDYMRQQPWGKFRGMQRCTMIQGMKAQLQAVLQGGDWSSAWLLTGLQDPIHRKEWAGSQHEMAVVSGYMKSLHKLKKQAKDAQQASATGEQE